jgi:hypothetical protein
MRTLLVASIFVLALSACGEKEQTAGTRKADAKAWEKTQSAYVAPGWTPGDAASWEEQMRKRAQGQNDYAKAPAQP